MLAVPEIISSRSDASIAREKLGATGPYSRGLAKCAHLPRILERHTRHAAGEEIHLQRRIVVPPAYTRGGGKNVIPCIGAHAGCAAHAESL